MSGADITDLIMGNVATGADIFAEMERLRAGRPRDDAPAPSGIRWTPALGEQWAEADRERYEKTFYPPDPTEAAVAERVAALRVYDRAQRQYQAETIEEAASHDRRARRMDGAEFALEVPLDVPVLVGTPNAPFSVDGEGTLIAGGDGVGKSTLVQQMMLGRLGLRPDFIGLPVQAASGSVLYLAMDRPQQIQRSLRRMVTEVDRDVLRERLHTWSGPLPFDPLATPGALADWIANTFGEDVSDVYVDSYKDLAPGLSEDRPGAQLNSAMQEVLARGMQWTGLHHQRKPAADRTHDYALSDIFGSRWITAGAGSVFLVLGDAGDETVELRHVKQPAGVVGPLFITHDHTRGVSTQKTSQSSVIGELVAADGAGLTLRDLSFALYSEDTKRLQQRITRELKRLMSQSGSGVHETPGTRGGAGGTEPKRWYFKADETVHSVSTSITRSHNSQGSA